MKAVKRRQTGLLFLPRNWQRNRILLWLRRVHAWSGFWGAILFFAMGLSGFLLNHRSVMKIDTGAPVEVNNMDVAVDPGLITDPKSLGLWAKKEFGLSTRPRIPRDGGRARETVEFLGAIHPQAEKWIMFFNLPNGRLTVEYVKGAAIVNVRQNAQNALGLIKNLHRGIGLGVMWVLFLDTIAGALIMMSVTGFLLWSRLHGSRFLALLLLVGSIVTGFLAVYPYLL